MKKVLDKKTYNTDTAIHIASISYGEFGDPYGFEECLYKTPRGNHFLYGKGGESSKYPSETIQPLTASQAIDWKKEHTVE